MEPSLITTLLLSLKVSALAIAVALPLAVLVASRLVGKSTIWTVLLNTIILLPLVMPPVVTGYLLLHFLGQVDFLAFKWTGAALAAGILAFPLIVRPIKLSMDAIDPGLKEAALSLGYTPFHVWLKVTLPLTLPGIIAGSILGLTKAMGEFGATITFVSNIPGETQTLSLAIHTALQLPNGEKIVIALALVSICLSVIAILFSELFTHYLMKRLGFIQHV